MYKHKAGAGKTGHEIYTVFQRVAKGYDSANVRISLGQHTAWKRRLVRVAVPKGIPEEDLTLLDVCCGTGDIALMMADAHPKARVTGIDFSEAMLAEAKAKMNNQKKVTLLQADALHMPFADHSFHAATISFGLRNTTDYARVLTEMCRVVKEDGYLCILDSFFPENRLVRPFYRIYFDLLMPFIGGGIRKWKDYRLLTETTRVFLSRTELKTLMQKTGLQQIRTKSSMFGVSVLLRGIKSEARRNHNYE